MISKSSPLVSIIIPTYNHAHFISQALESLVAQTHSNWEALIMNNFSTDNTVEVVEYFRDQRIKLTNFQNNGIIAASRNQGIRLAQGDFIAFLDSDDYWMPEKLEKCLAAMRNLSVDVVCHAEIWKEVNGSERVVQYGPAKRVTYQSLLYRGNVLSTSALLVRKKLLDELGGFSEKLDFVTAEDYELWLRMAKNGARFHFLSDVIGVYRLHGSSESQNIERHMLANMNVLEARFDKNSSWGMRLKRRHRYALLYYASARAFYKMYCRRLAIRYFLKTLVYSPFILRLYPAIVFVLLPQRRGL